MLDVAQIFGRAGRPQFDTDGGEGIIITTHQKLAHYCGMMTHATPIESQFIEGIASHHYQSRNLKKQKAANQVDDNTMILNMIVTTHVFNWIVIVFITIAINKKA